MPDEKYRIWLEPSIKLDSDQLKKDIEALKDTIQKSVNSLADKQLKLKMEFTKVDSGMLNDIKSGLESINLILDSINKKSLGASISISAGNKAKSNILALEQQARTLLDIYDGATRKLDELMNAASRGRQLHISGELAAAMYEMKSVGEFTSAIDLASIENSSTKLSSIIGKMREFLSLMRDSGFEIDMTPYEELEKNIKNTSGSAENLAEKLEKVLNPQQKQQSPINNVVGADGINKSIDEISGSFDNLRSKIEATLDLSTVDMHVDSVNSRLEEIKIVQPNTINGDESTNGVIHETSDGLKEVAQNAVEASTKLADMKASVLPTVDAVGDLGESFKTATDYARNNIPESLSIVVDEEGKAIQQTAQWRDVLGEVDLQYKQVQKTTKKGTQVTGTITVAKDEAGINAAKRALEDYINKLIEATDKAAEFGLLENEDAQLLIKNYGAAANLLEHFDDNISTKGLNSVKGTIDGLITSSRGAEHSLSRVIDAVKEQENAQQRYQKEVSKAYSERDRQIKAEESAILKEASAEQVAEEAAQRRAEKEEEAIRSQVAGWEKLQSQRESAATKEDNSYTKLGERLGAYIAKLKELSREAINVGLGDEKGVKNLNDIIVWLEDLQTRMRNSDSSGLEKFNNEFINIHSSAEIAKRSVQDVLDEFRNQPKAIEPNTREYFDAVAKLSNLKQQILRDIRNSSAAKNGTAAQSYKDLEGYAKNVDDLNVKLKNTELTNESFAKSFAELRANSSSASASIREAGEMTSSFGERIKKNARNLAAYFSVSRMFTTVIRYMRDLIKTSIELDKEMGQLRIVTDETETAYSQYADTISDTAKTISASMTDLISATTTFARLGYSLDESSALAKYTAMLQQVGDIDASAAQNAITAITKAFANEVDVNNIESVMDRLVKVGRMVAHVCSNAYLVIGYNGQSRFGIIA